MIVCPNCNHQNPEGATQCEACYTPLAENITCPQCGASLQPDARFCGQCGYNLVTESGTMNSETYSGGEASPEELFNQVVASANSNVKQSSPNLANYTPVEGSELDLDMSKQTLGDDEEEEEIVSGTTPTFPVSLFTEAESATATPEATLAPTIEPEIVENISTTGSVTPDKIEATQLQVQTVSLLHIQTSTKLELPQGIAVIHVGKPNDRVPPDIDVTGFPSSEIVSRIHADIRIEAGNYYLEDVGSANGTYVNHTPLQPGNRHRLRSGDRIALGKGDRVTFIFQMN